MSKVVYTIAGDEIVLTDVIASGGEAEIYKTNKDGVLIKLFTRDISLISKLKIFTLCKKGNLDSLKEKTSHFSMPLLPLFKKSSRNSYNDLCGYVMYQKSGTPLHDFLNLAKIKTQRTLVNSNRIDLVNMLIDLLSSIHVLHSNNIVIGDLSLRNFLYDEATREVNIIDCDSFQYTLEVSKQAIDEVQALSNHKKLCKSKEEIEEDKVKMLSRILYCEMTTDEYTSPELIPAFEAGKLGVTERTVNNELFGIAVLIFKTLMLGKNPFSTNVGSLSPLEAIKNNEFPYKAYYSEQKKLPSGCWNILWSHLPYDIQDEFIKTFTTDQRTDISTWINRLKDYKNYMSKNSKEAELIFAKLKRGRSKPKPKQDIVFDENQMISLTDI